MTPRTWVRRYRTVLIVAAMFLGGGVCFMAVGAIFCAATLHVRRSVSATPANASTIEIRARDNATLSAWWLQPPKQNGSCVVVLHGIADSRGSSVGFAPMFLERDYAVLVPDSRAHGASGGAFVTYGLLEKYDVVDWAHWMQGQGCRKIYGLGESLGAGILIQAAAVQPTFAAIAAECPYADLWTIGEYRVRQMVPAPDFIAVPLATLTVASGMFYARFADGLDFRQVSPVDSIRQTRTPILLIHGLNDRRTPPWNSQQLAAANPSDPLWLVPGADHTQASSVAPEEFRRHVLGWFAAH